MAFTKVVTLTANTFVALGKINKETGVPYPEQAEGHYLGSTTKPSDFGLSTTHFLQQPTENLGVYGTSNLNAQLSKVKLGTMVRITSTGTRPSKKKGRQPMYTYLVEQDKTNVIDVDSASATPAAESSDEYSDDYDEVANDSDQGYDASDEDAAQNAALAAAERKAKADKVKELFANAGKTKVK